MDQGLRLDMPTMMSTHNPIDIIGDADSARVRQILKNISTVTPTGDIIFFFTVQATTDIIAISQSLISFYSEYSQYTIFVGLIGGTTIEQAKKKLADAGIYVSQSTELMIGSYTKLLEWKHGKMPKFIIPPHVSRQPETSPILMDQNATEKILAEYSITTTETFEYQTLEAVREHAKKFI